MIRLWLRGLLARRTPLLVATAAGVAITVALLSSLGSFLATAQSSMTARATVSVAVDWQIQVSPTASIAAVRRTVLKAPGVTAALTVGYGHTIGLSATTQGTTQVTGPGVILGIPDNYASTFPAQVRYLTGARTGVLVAQQTASNLHIVPGDKLQIGLAGGTTIPVTVAGVVDLPQANSLFQTVGVPAQSQPSAPPDNVVLLPAAEFARVSAALARIGGGQLTTQLHVKRSHALPPDPAVAFVTVASAANNLSAALAGSGVIGDNLAASLDAARGDASYATILFLFLGLPGAVLSAMLTIAVASSGADRRRREQALLRARGASRGHIIQLVTAESAIVAAAGISLGLAASFALSVASFGAAHPGTSTGDAWAWPVAAAVIGALITLLAIAVPALRDYRAMIVAEARSDVSIGHRPLWMRLYVDFILLATAAVILAITSQSSYTLVLAPEGVLVIQVNYWAFLGPGLLWIGAGLLVWRLVDLGLRRGVVPLGRLLRPIGSDLSTTIASSLSLQRRSIARATVVFALSLAFAASTAIFNSTYQQQAEVDARLTNGADVTVTEPPQASAPATAGAKFRTIPGVTAVEPLQHRFAYVGSDLQDLFGVRASTIAQSTSLQNAYFQGGTAQQLMSKLAVQPDAILVSAETVKDYQLHPGELIRLRLQDNQSHQLITVPFHYVGVANEFPTAPKDSFFIANADYITRSTHNASVGAFLVTTSPGSTDTVAQSLRHALGTNATVTSITAARASVGSSLTAVDLSGLTRLELFFALVLAAAAGGLVFAVGLVERRRTLAITAVLGASRHQRRGWVLSEAAVIALSGTIAGGVIGALLSQSLVAVLTGVFDPPPDTLAIPWVYLITTVVIAYGAVAVAALISARPTSRPAIEQIREN